MNVQGMALPPVPVVSVVVPTYKRAAALRRCLDALLAQRIDPAAFEIIVVDDGHEDQVRDMVLDIATWIRAPQVRYLRPMRGQGPGVARNRGWRAAKGVLVAFTEDDTIPQPDWLEAGARAFETNRQWVALSGATVGPSETAQIAQRGAFGATHTTRALSNAEFVTANAFVWRTALEALGGFDEQFSCARHEDSDLQFRLLTEVGGVGFCADAKVVHPVSDASWGVSLRQQRDTYFDALLYKKHPRLYRERIRRIPPWDYYVIAVLSIATPFLWAANEDAGAAMSAAVVLALVLRLAWRRLRATDDSPRRLIEMLATSAVIPFLSVYWRVRGALRFKVLFL